MSGSGADGSAATLPGPTFRGRTLHAGTARGPLLRLDSPLSFWGGVDATGRIIDVHHPQCGQSVTGTVLVMTSGRGSSSSTAVLAELIRSGAAPVAIVLAERDVILVIAALVASELYDVAMPIVVLSAADLELLPDGNADVAADPGTLAATVQVAGAA